MEKLITKARSGHSIHSNSIDEGLTEVGEKVNELIEEVEKIKEQLDNKCINCNINPNSIICIGCKNYKAKNNKEYINIDDIAIIERENDERNGTNSIKEILEAKERIEKGEYDKYDDVFKENKEHINIGDNVQGIKTELPPFQKSKQRNMTKEESEEYEKILESQYKKTGNKMFDEEKQDKLKEILKKIKLKTNNVDDYCFKLLDMYSDSKDNEHEIRFIENIQTGYDDILELYKQAISSLQQQLQEKEELLKDREYISKESYRLLNEIWDYVDKNYSDKIKPGESRLKFLINEIEQLKNNKIKGDKDIKEKIHDLLEKYYYICEPKNSQLVDVILSIIDKKDIKDE